MNSLEVHGKKRTYTLKLQPKKGEIPQKLQFAASFHPSLPCHKTLAFQEFCFIMYFQPDGRRDEMTGHYGCQRGADQPEKIMCHKLFCGTNTIKLLTMVHLSTQH